MASLSEQLLQREKSISATFYAHKPVVVSKNKVGSDEWMLEKILLAVKDIPTHISMCKRYYSVKRELGKWFPSAYTDLPPSVRAGLSQVNKRKRKRM